MMRTQVGIVGAGPAGLMLSHLLHLNGIESVIVEERSRAYCESRVRAGLIEQWARDLIVKVGLGERLQREGLLHQGIKLNFGTGLHAIDFVGLVGRAVTIYGQQELVKDMMARRLEADGGRIVFEAEQVSVHDLDGERPKIRFRHEGHPDEIECDFIGGCDGFHGICRPSIPDGVLTLHEREYPFAWAGILTESPPPDEQLIYCSHQRGFALFSMRSPNVGRFYVQCGRDESEEDWPDERMWEELHARLNGARPLMQGKVLQKLVAPLRSFAVEPMQFGRLFLAGDSAHIVPPTGAKGMNLAIADVLVLSRAIAEFYKTRRTEQLVTYSQTCLRRMWKAQRFSWWMTQMLHRFPDESSFDRRRREAEMDYVTSSDAASMTLAENYTGLPMDI